MTRTTQAGMAGHVAHLHFGTEWGGGENQVLNLVSRLVAGGLRCTLFTPRDGALFSKAETAGLPVQAMPAGVRFPGLAPGARAVARFCKETGVGLIHAHDSRSLAVATAVSRRLRIPLVYSRRIASPLRRNPLSRRKYSSRNIKAVIAISQTVKEVFVKSGYPAQQVHVVPSGIDLARLSQAQVDPELRSAYGGRRLIVGLGKLSRKKNWPFLVKVAAHMAEKGPDIQWLIAGEGPERRKIEKFAEDSNVSCRVHLLGMRTDAARIVKTADVFFSPSVAEGAGLSIREAMAVGTPVLAVDAPGSAESLGGNGWLVKDGDIEGAAEAIREILSNESRRAVVCAAARALAISRYDFEHTVEGTLAVYRLAGAAHRELRPKRR